MTQQNNFSGRKFIITKKIAKHGNQSIIVVPRMLECHLPPGTVVQLGIDIISEVGIEEEEK